MNKRRGLKKSKPMTIQQNIPADPPQSFERNEDMVDANLDASVEELVPMPEEVVEIPVVATTREAINFELKGLSVDIAKLKPHSDEWKALLHKIHSLHGKLKALK